MNTTVLTMTGAVLTLSVTGAVRGQTPAPAAPTSETKADAPAAAGVRVYDFEDTSCCGVAPEPKWEAAQTNPSEKPAEWNTYASSSAASGTMYLSARGPGTGGSNTFSVLIARDTSYKDLELSVKVMPSDGKEDRGGGVIWRVTDANNYYVARWNPLENNLRIYTVKDGKRTQIASQDTKPDAGGWHSITVIDVGAKITARLDDGAPLEADDSTFAGAGRVGLWLKSDASTLFDDLRVADKSEKKE